jgi:hypothetical protein
MLTITDLHSAHQRLLALRRVEDKP